MAPSQRRRSIDSSSSEFQSEFSPDQKKNGGGAQPGDPTWQAGHHEPSPPSYSPPGPSTSTSNAPPGLEQSLPQLPPPSGYRIPLGPGTTTPSSPSPSSLPASSPSFPGIERTREAPFTDADGKSPVFLGSALMQNSVHPCKIVPSMLPNQACHVSYGGIEVTHEGRYDLLPFVPALMEFVLASNGHVPYGRKPVKGGYEQDGTELYHAVAVIDGVKVPGKTGTHLGGCNVPYGGREHAVKEKYEILCWKF